MGVEGPVEVVELVVQTVVKALAPVLNANLPRLVDPPIDESRSTPLVANPVERVAIAGGEYQWAGDRARTSTLPQGSDRGSVGGLDRLPVGVG